jgi:uncharacterized protein YdeI (YjbR/CyaY-like superfamily)
MEFLAFRDAAAFESWLADHHATRSEVWLRIAKKTSGLPSVTAAEADEVALCYGWIDSHRKALDGSWFLQRFSPRRRRSPWSRINADRVRALTAAGRMRPAGLAAVAAARADGRWPAATARPT